MQNNKVKDKLWGIFKGYMQVTNFNHLSLLLERNPAMSRAPSLHNMHEIGVCFSQKSCLIFGL